MRYLNSLLLMAQLYTGRVVAQAVCPPLGPALPPPRQPSANRVVQSAGDFASNFLKNRTASWNGSAIAVSVGSIHETKPLYEWSIEGPVNANTSGTVNIDQDTIFLTGSGSKVFTAYAVLLLADKIDLYAPVTKYLPQLRHLTAETSPNNPVTTVDWDAVSIASLMSHMSGIVENFALGDFAILGLNSSVLAAGGFPPFDATIGPPKCLARGTYPGCSPSQFYSDFGHAPPIYAPWTSPVYSNVGFGLLGLVIEAVTNTTYASYLQSAIFDPLNMTSTSVIKPTDAKRAFISHNPNNYFGTDLGIGTAAGGIYTSSSDYFRFGQSILRSTLLTPLQTRQWLKPVTFTDSISSALGMPWEIVRGSNLAHDGRPIDVYTKQGDLGDFHSFLALVPDYDLVFTIVSGGPDAGPPTLAALFSALATQFVPALDAAARAEAQMNYAGTYVDGGNSVTLSVDDGPGLLVSNFSVRGAAIGPAFAAIEGSALAPFIRLYPGSLSSDQEFASAPANATDCGASRNSSASNIVKQGWQALFNSTSLAAQQKEDDLFFWQQGSCETWGMISLLSYQNVPIGSFAIGVDEDGRGVSVEARAWRAEMRR